MGENSPNDQDFREIMKVIAFILFWAAIVGFFNFYGFYDYDDADIKSSAYLGLDYMAERRVENRALWGGFGVGLATYLTTGLVMISLVRSKTLKWGWAILVLIVSIPADTILMLICLNESRNTSSYPILQSKSGFDILGYAAQLVFVSVFACVMFSVILLLVRKGKATHLEASSENES